MKSSIKRILLATDFSDISKNAGDHALFLSNFYKAELIVLNVLDTNGPEFPSYYYFSAKGFDRLAEDQKLLLPFFVGDSFVEEQFRSNPQPVGAG